MYGKKEKNVSNAKRIVNAVNTLTYIEEQHAELLNINNPSQFQNELLGQLTRILRQHGQAK